MNYSRTNTRIVLLIPLIFISLLFSCTESTQTSSLNPQEEPEAQGLFSEGYCLPPAELGIADFYVADDSKDAILYQWTPVQGAIGYEFRISVNDYVSPVLTDMVYGHNAYLVESLFDIDDRIHAKVRAVCSNGSYSSWKEETDVFRNGGATVDDIPSNANWEAVCGSTCEYLRFVDNEITDCEGDKIELGLTNGHKRFFLKESVCACIYEEDLCYGLENIKSCLRTSYLKRNYQTCDPE